MRRGADLETSLGRTDTRARDTEANEVERIDPEEYVRILRGISLSGVSLTRCQTVVNRGVAESIDGTPIPVTFTDEAEFQREDGGVIVRHKYSVRARRGRKTLFSLKAEFAVKMVTDHGFTEAFFSAFRETSLPLVTWPYLRELVGSMTERMELPTLHLGLWKMPF
jgi:hypothetical protein